MANMSTEQFARWAVIMSNEYAEVLDLARQYEQALRNVRNIQLCAGDPCRDNCINCRTRKYISRVLRTGEAGGVNLPKP